MRTIIAGGRDYVTALHVEVAMITCPWRPTEVVCGEARGADRFGKAWAQARGIPVGSFPAQWRTPWGGKNHSAGFERNEAMSLYAEALVLCWDGQSSGSSERLQRARAKQGVEHPGEGAAPILPRAAARGLA